MLIEADGTPTTCNSQTRPCPRRYYCREGPDVISAVCCPDSKPILTGERTFSLAVDYAETLAADKRDKQNFGAVRYAYVMPPVESEHKQQQMIDSLPSAVRPAINVQSREGQLGGLTR